MQPATSPRRVTALARAFTAKRAGRFEFRRLLDGSGVAALIALRVVVGLGLGAELPVASTYVSELAPARMRGRLIVILEAFWAIGWTAAALIGFFVIPASADGWRWAFALGAIPALYALIVRWGLPESPRWLAQRGRDAEASEVVAGFESTSAVSLSR